MKGHSVPQDLVQRNKVMCICSIYSMIMLQILKSNIFIKKFCCIAMCHPYFQIFFNVILITHYTKLKLDLLDRSFFPGSFKNMTMLAFSFNILLWS